MEFEEWSEIFFNRKDEHERYHHNLLQKQKSKPGLIITVKGGIKINDSDIKDLLENTKCLFFQQGLFKFHHGTQEIFLYEEKQKKYGNDIVFKNNILTYIDSRNCNIENNQIFNIRDYELTFNNLFTSLKEMFNNYDIFISLINVKNKKTVSSDNFIGETILDDIICQKYTKEEKLYEKILEDFSRNYANYT